MGIWGLFLWVSFQSAFACSTFLLEGPGKMYFGKSYDWDQGHGALLVNPRGLSKRALALHPTDKNPHVWESLYGSLTFNQVARELPLAGINEKGLTVEIMVVGSQDPDPDTRPTVNELQWIQYVLDRYESVKDVMEHLEEVRISRVQAQVHYLVCDVKGICGSVEVLGKKFVRHWGETMPVKALTNHPYSQLLDYLDKFVGFGGALAMPTSQHSMDRFARVAMLAKAGEATQDYAFSILKTVFTPHHSQWNVVYDLNNLSVAYKTNPDEKARHVEVKDLDFSCRKNVVARDLESDKFTEFTPAKNAELLNETVKLHPLPPAAVTEILKYPDSLSCL